MFMKFNKEPILDLKEVIETIDERIKSRVKEREVFTYCTDNPVDY